MLGLYKKTLTEFLSIRSISTSPEYAEEMGRAVAWLEKFFKSNGFAVRVYEGYGNPVVLATLQVDPNLETCLVYGHYDVQPAEKSEGWHSDPFALTERDGRLFGRGVVDNKGQVLIHMLSISQLAAEKKLGYNVKFIIEGDEETGSGRLDELIKDNLQALSADFVMLSDGEFGDFPIMEAGFRGGFNATLTLKTSHTDLHSGVYGTAAPNAAHEMANLLSTFYDEHHRVRFKGFYDDVDEISQDVLSQHQALPFSLDAHKQLSGTKALLSEPGFDFYTQIGLRPSLQVTGIQSGYTGEGYRNSISGKATAKINFRLVKSQDPRKIAEIFETHIKENLPDHVEHELEFHDFHEGVKLNLENDYTTAAVQALVTSHGQKPSFKYCGGGLPVVTHFDQILNLPTLSVPLGNEDCAMHAVDENFRIDYIEKGLKFSREFFSK